MSEPRDYLSIKIDELWEMMHHDIDGLRNYAKEADEAFARIREIERSMKGSAILNHWKTQLGEIFEIARSFERK